MYNTLIAGGGRTLSFPFVVHLQDVLTDRFFLADAWPYC